MAADPRWCVIYLDWDERNDWKKPDANTRKGLGGEVERSQWHPSSLSRRRPTSSLPLPPSKPLTELSLTVRAASSASELGHPHSGGRGGGGEPHSVPTLSPLPMYVSLSSFLFFSLPSG